MKRVEHDLYAVWRGMRSRCFCRSNISFPYYGGMGINICEEWNDFWSFVDDMGPRPSKRHQIERIDNSKGYDRNNCRWATRLEQQSNTKRNRWLTINGTSKTLSEWGRTLGLPKSTIRFRLRKGWSIANALTRTRYNRWSIRNLPCESSSATSA
jgi:hypothetical protein